MTLQIDRFKEGKPGIVILTATITETVLNFDK